MLASVLGRVRLRSGHLQALSVAAVAQCVALWIRAKTIGEDERGNAERRALFVGLWPSMLWLIGEELSRREAEEARLTRRLLRRR
jgi:hypothetical protein